MDEYGMITLNVYALLQVTAAGPRAGQANKFRPKGRPPDRPPPLDPPLALTHHIGLAFEFLYHKKPDFTSLTLRTLRSPSIHPIDSIRIWCCIQECRNVCKNLMRNLIGAAKIAVGALKRLQGRLALEKLGQQWRRFKPVSI